MGHTFARRATWGVSTFLCLLVGAYALNFVVGGFADVPEDIASNDFLDPFGLRLHIAVTAIALIVAPWQFARRLRNRLPLVHRTMGRIYLITGFVGIGTYSDLSRLLAALDWRKIPCGPTWIDPEPSFAGWPGTFSSKVPAEGRRCWRRSQNDCSCGSRHLGPSRRRWAAAG